MAEQFVMSKTKIVTSVTLREGVDDIYTAFEDGVAKGLETAHAHDIEICHNTIARMRREVPAEAQKNKAFIAAVGAIQCIIAAIEGGEVMIGRTKESVS